MELNAAEISSILKNQIKDFGKDAEVSEIGQVLSVGDGIARVYEALTGNYLFTLRGHRNKVESVAFSSNGKLIATSASDRTIRLWNPKTGEPTKLLFTRYDHNVCSLSLSPDGLMLARGSHNKDIKIWEVTTGTELMTLLGKDQYDHHWSVCVAFSPDGIHLASGTDIGKIKLWEVLPSGEEKVLHDGHWQRDADDDRTDAEPDQEERRHGKFEQHEHDAQHHPMPPQELHFAHRAFHRQPERLEHD